MFLFMGFIHCDEIRKLGKCVRENHPHADSHKVQQPRLAGTQSTERKELCDNIISTVYCYTVWASFHLRTKVSHLFAERREIIIIIIWERMKAALCAEASVMFRVDFVLWASELYILKFYCEINRSRGRSFGRALEVLLHLVGRRASNASQKSLR